MGSSLQAADLGPGDHRSNTKCFLEGFHSLIETPYSPAVLFAAGRSATALTLGSYHTCALLGSGDIVCWGDNTWGQLGIETATTVGNKPGQMGANLVAVKLGDGEELIQIRSCVLMVELRLFVRKCAGRIQRMFSSMPDG
jgi:hypothetical protein